MDGCNAWWKRTVVRLMFGCEKEGKGSVWNACQISGVLTLTVRVYNGKETGLVDKENKSVQVGTFDC